MNHKPIMGRTVPRPRPMLLSRDLYVPLERYLPLGSITAPGRAYHPSSAEWTEVADSSSLRLLPDEIQAPTKALIEQKWLRLHVMNIDNIAVFRVYLLPADAARSIVQQRTPKNHLLNLTKLLKAIDTSPEAWNGNPTGHNAMPFDAHATPIEGSLFYLFNTLPSPSPALESISDRYSHHAASGLLENPPYIPGLRTRLFPFQARSAAAMIERESSFRLHADPRYEARKALDGQTFYYCARDAIFLRDPIYWEAPKGGILAETMGLGKTVICLALILATKGHVPRIPQEHDRHPSYSTGVPSLSRLAADTAGRHGLPVKSFLARKRRERGEHIRFHDASSRPQYTITANPSVLRTNTRAQPPPREFTLCGTTIIVVPQNLVHQWKFELKKHVSESRDGLRVLYMDQMTSRLPRASKIAKYDIVLFSRNRFGKEWRLDSAGPPQFSSRHARGLPYKPPDNRYSSPLKSVHFLRIIIDEGHEFSSTSSDAVQAARMLVKTDRKWVVSGTPARDRLFGVEVELAADVSFEEESQVSTEAGAEFNGTPEYANGLPITAQSVRAAALDRRKAFTQREECLAAAKSLGILAKNFLGVQPWAGSDGERGADWEDYIYRHESHQSQSRTHSSFSLGLKSTLETLVVKTRPEDVEVDVLLPPLHHKVVPVEPSFYDALTANLFVFFLTANAVTSEREDSDYIFHPKSRTARSQLITNLRQSAFTWTGFTPADVEAAIEHSRAYLAKEDTKCTAIDRALLQECLTFARFILACKGWKELCAAHELGVFVKDWPSESRNVWALTNDGSTAMIGITQLAQAQMIVNSRLTDADPLEGLAIAGRITMALVEEHAAAEKESRSKPTYTHGKMGVPSSGILVEPSANKSHQLSKALIRRLTKPNDAEAISQSEGVESPLRPPKRRRSTESYEQSGSPSETSRLEETKIVGTTSAKLSYLLDKVAEHHRDEKILIFYDADNTAYYLAQCLDLMHVKHLIYTRSLSQEQRSVYIVNFEEDDSIRVLLMDIRAGALGLNVNKASRVFFINPACRPAIEAQAIKRAHRIGQTRPVFVETLVLRGSVEEAIFHRSKAMTSAEHHSAKELTDDSGMAQAVQTATLLPFTHKDGSPMAPLKVPLRLFGQADDDSLVNEGPKKRVKRGLAKRQERAGDSALALCDSDNDATEHEDWLGSGKASDLEQDDCLIPEVMEPGDELGTSTFRPNGDMFGLRA
ncbi:hypothetical protein EJ06DRAFT_502181 [Trichodelitschia bisporula]|uniref:Helicase C-terminal domain-containing protein n=1 Tax=Trichodelitschia bisporula TaxID=703511 RepID=A0A6G1IB15_9PEZI|nr:hypothetical protein EJ06DRAFT_502181 [Trichodelitschia bisporula]